MYQSQKGVTLIELAITVTVISILAVIAVPSYQQHVRKSQRSDAKAALMRVAAEQEKYYFQNSRYASLAELGDPATERGWYTLAVTANDANTFAATATAKSGEPQFGDKPCRTFRITAEGLRSASDSAGADADDCW